MPGGPEAQSRQSTSAPASEATDDKQGREAGSVREAMDAVMDTPHPLDILGEPGSYGFDGAISRYDLVHLALSLVMRRKMRDNAPSWKAKSVFFVAALLLTVKLKSMSSLCHCLRVSLILIRCMGLQFCV